MECDHAVALIDESDAEYGNNCVCGPVICGVSFDCIVDVVG